MVWCRSVMEYSSRSAFYRCRRCVISWKSITTPMITPAGFLIGAALSSMGISVPSRRTRMVLLPSPTPVPLAKTRAIGSRVFRSPVPSLGVAPGRFSPAGGVAMIFPPCVHCPARSPGGVSISAIGCVSRGRDCPTVGDRIVSAAGVHVVRRGTKPTPNNHLAPSPDSSMAPSRAGRVRRTCTRPGIECRTVAPAAARVAAEQINSAPDDHLAPRPHGGGIPPASRRLTALVSVQPSRVTSHRRPRVTHRKRVGDRVGGPVRGGGVRCHG